MKKTRSVKRKNWDAHHGSYQILEKIITPPPVIQIAFSVLLAAGAGYLMGSPLWGVFFLLLLIVDYMMLAGLPMLDISFGAPGPPALLLSVFRIVILLITSLLGSEVSLVIQLIILGSAFWAEYIEPQWIEVNEYRFGIKGDKTGPVLKMLQISDLHVEGVGRRELKLISLIKKIEPDIIVLTGDYLNHCQNLETPAVGHFRDFAGLIPKPPLGIHAVLGTDHVDIRELMDRLFDGLDINLMTAECITIAKGETEIDLIGVRCDRRVIEEDLTRLDQAMADSTGERTRVLLYHTPGIAEDAADREIDLYLAGHTHGGQIALPFYGAIVTYSDYGKRFERGMYDVEKMKLYVNRGFGSEGFSAPRVRFFSRPEIAVFHFQKSDIS